MSRLAALSVVLLLVLRAGAARADRELIVPFHESGHVVIDQLAGLRMDSTGGMTYAAPAGIAFQSVKVGGAEQHVTSLWLAPSADIFVTDHLSLGALASVTHTFGDNVDTTSLAFVPRIGLYVPFGDRFGIWPRIGLGYTSQDSFKAALFDADLSLVYRFTESFFMRTGPGLSLTLGGTNDTTVMQVTGILALGVNLEP